MTLGLSYKDKMVPIAVSVDCVNIKLCKLVHFITNSWRHQRQKNAGDSS